MKTAVKAIIQKIDALEDQDRLALEQELARRLEREWTKEATQARKEARRKGIDQAAIDRAIELRRYGR